MNILYIIKINTCSKSGLYYSATDRIRAYRRVNDKDKVEVVNVGGRVPYAIRRVLMKTGSRKGRYLDRFYEAGVHGKNIFGNTNIVKWISAKCGIATSQDWREYVEILSKYASQFDLISAHYGNGPGEIAYGLSVATGIPFAVTYHGTDIHTTPFLSMRNYELRRKMLRNASASIFVSEALKEVALSIAEFKDNMFVLENAVDTVLFNRTSGHRTVEDEWRIKPHERVIGYVGNLVEVKNVVALARIVNELSYIYSEPVRLVVIGDGPLKKELKVLARTSRVPISLIGKVEREELPAYYAMMDVLVLPSKREGQGMVLLEALACGVPCVGSMVGGIPATIGANNCVELGPDFERMMAEKIKKVLVGEAMMTLPGIGAEIDEIAKREHEIYRKILEV